MDKPSRKNFDGIRIQRTNRTSPPTRSFDEPPKKTRVPQTEKTDVPEISLIQKRESSFRFRPTFRFLRNTWVIRSMTAVFTLVLLFFALNISYHARVSVRPGLEWIPLSDTLTLLHNPPQGVLGFDVMVISEEVSIPVIAEGVRAVRHTASGTVTLYNDYSTEPQRLLPETRFESAGGKIFQLGIEEVIVPGKTSEGPGSVTVTIYAQQAGEEYNIESTDFSIPGFRELGLNDKYHGMYAVSTERFEGGFIGQEMYLSDEQKQHHEGELYEALQKKLAERLEYEKTETMYVVPNGVRMYPSNPVVVSGEDSEHDFLVQEGKMFALILDTTLVNSYLHDRYIVSEGMDVEFLKLGKLDFQLVNERALSLEIPDALTFSFDAEMLVQKNLDEDTFKQYLAGQHQQHIISRIDQRDDIDTLRLKIVPFWRRYLPQKLEDIRLVQERGEEVLGIVD